MPHVYFCLSVLLLLAMPGPISSWSRPPWYQVGLDLQPWGCQPNSVDGCEISLGCPGRWMGLGMNRIHPVAWLMGGTIAVLMLGHTALRWRTQAQSEFQKVTRETPVLGKRRVPASDRAVLLQILHMLDALLIHIECHLHQLATQQQIQIKVIPVRCGDSKKKKIKKTLSGSQDENE